MRVLFIDDEPGILEQAKIFLEREDDRLDVDTVSSPEKGLNKLENQEYEVIVSDYKFSGLDGLELLKKIKERYKDVLFIMLTGRGSEEIKEKAFQHGSDGYMKKGKSPKVLFKELAEKIISET